MLWKKISIATCIGTTIQVFAFAKPTPIIDWCEEVVSVMRLHRDSASSALQCQPNLWNLLQGFNTRNRQITQTLAQCAPNSNVRRFSSTIPIDRANLLFIFPSQHEFRLRPFNTGSTLPAWRFHTVVEIDGLIADAEMMSPDILPPGHYYQAMFDHQDDGMKKMLRSLGLLSPFNPLEGSIVKSIPADEFLAEFNQTIAGVKRDEIYFMKRIQEQPGTLAIDYFNLRAFGTIPRPEPKLIDPKLAGEVAMIPQPKVKDLVDLRWVDGETTCELNLGTGEITLTRNGKSVHDPSAFTRFIQKLYFESQKNASLQNALQAGLKYRQRFDF